MRALLHLFLPLILLMASSLAPMPPPLDSRALAEGKPFAHAGLAKDGERYETYLKTHWKPGKERPERLIAAAQKALAKDKDQRAAARNYAMAVVAEPGSVDAWLGLAEALLAIQPDPNKGSERFDLPVNASGAAYLAYDRAKTRAEQARALVVLADALKRRAFWRPAIEALKTSVSLVPDAKAQAALERLSAEHGFRMTDYRIDSDIANPRVCLQFSETLSRAPVEFSQFVTIGGKDPAGVNVELKQLCIEGVKHGERYEIQIKAGLPSDVGETLTKTVDVAVYVPDRQPSVRFTGRSYVLPSRGQQGIPVVSINTAVVGVQVYRIGDRNLAQTLQNGDIDRQLSTWDLETIQNRSGELVYTGELPVAEKINAEVTTAVPVGDAVGTLKPGAYVMIARPKKQTGDHEGQVATQWFIVSDLGLTAFSGGEGLHAFVRSLADTKPVGAAKVRVVARNNEILAEATSDERGYVRFPASVSKGEGGLAPAILVAEKGDGSEYAFLDLTAAAFDLSDRGVKGRDAPGPIDAFIFPERGVYRPGETVQLTGLVRDDAGKSVTTPMTLVVVRPDGVEHRRIVLKDGGLGGRAYSLDLASSAMTGTWRARLHVDPSEPAIAQVSFMVEDFMPERLDMTLKAPEGALKTSEPGTIDVDGKYLYGPPAAGLALEGEIIVRPVAGDIAGYPGFRFGLADETVTPVRAPLEDLPETDASGHAALPVKLPQIPDTVKPLEAQVLVRLKEPGGRGIERSVTVPVAANKPRVGIKTLFKADDLGEEGGNAKFEVIYLDAAGKRAEVKAVNWQLLRLDTSWQWYSRDGSWSYDAVTFTRKIANGSIDIGTDAPVAISAPVTYGRYRLEVTTSGEIEAQSSVTFSAGWFTSADNPDSPEVLDVALDKASYMPGDTAKLRIASKHAGTALISVLGGSLIETHEVAIEKGGGEVPIKVGNDWGPGAYVTAMLYRPMDESLKRMPGRSLGLAWLGIDQQSRSLDIAINAPEKVKGGAKVTVPVSISGIEPGQEARLTLAAVDIGVLNVTHYKSPDPRAHFYAQRKLGVEIRDFYGRLIDGMRAERGTLRSGGDGDGGVEMQGSPSVEEIVSLYSGIVAVGADGKAEVSFDMPDFNGSVRLMAVAWSAGKLGSAAKDMIVRDAVALTLTSPRFLTLGDEARLTLDVHNVEGPAALYEVSIDRSAATVEQSPRERITDKAIDLAVGAKKVERVTLKPDNVGLYAYDVRLKGPGGIDVARRLTIDVKPPAGDIKRTTVAKLTPGGSLKLSRDLITDLIESRTRINLSAGPQARFDIPGLLTQLDRYPYGCAEQTVSRALPLVYANSVATRIGLGADAELKARVQKAIEHVFSMQDSTGAFGIWGPSTADLWLTAYVTDFLTRTKEAGYTVPALPFTNALDRLQNYISYAQDFEMGGEDRAYALYVLSRNGRAPMGELRYYVDTRLDRFATPLAKAQLGAALALLGDKVRAEKAFNAALADLEKSNVDLSRDDYGSRLRDGAALLTLASETGIAMAEAPRLVDVIAKYYISRGYTSTQEQAWLLLAANALANEAASARLSFDGAPLTPPFLRPLTPLAISKEGGLVVRNDGDAAVDVVVSVIGAALTPEPPISKGFTITRSYYTLDGKEVSLKSAEGGTATLAQNDRLVAVVKVETREAGGRVLLVDRLPSGLEIENPRLVASGDIKSLQWLEGTVSAEHAEFRDDRFVAAFNLFPKRDDNASATATDAVRTAAAAYIVRAVTPGKFVHPAATVEDMYRPERYARSAAGTLIISGKE